MSGIPKTLPVFCMPNTVLLPGADLPLMVFNPVHQQMISEVIATSRMLAVCQTEDKHDLLKSPLRKVGTVGVIVTHNKLRNGGLNVFVRGLDKIIIGKEVSNRPYREVEIELCGDGSIEMDELMIRNERSSIMRKLYQGSCQDIFGPFPDGSLDRLSHSTTANFIALCTRLLNFSAERMQELLELDGINERMKGLTAIINEILLEKAVMADCVDLDDEYSH